MYITAHATIGIFIGERISNPVLGFFFGVFSHFICDIIPHGDTQFEVWVNRHAPYNKTIFYVIACVDYGAMLTMLWFISPTLTLTSSVVASTISTIVPDLLWAWYDIARWKIFATYRRIHHDLHNVLPRDVPYWFGLLYQILLVVFLISIRT